MQRVRFAMCSAVMVLFSSLAGQAQAQTTPAPPPATVTGSGTANYIPMWTGSSTLGNSKLYQKGGEIGVATTSPTVELDVNGRVNISKSYRIGGTDVLNTPGTGNTAVGQETLLFITGQFNTALGDQALRNATNAFFNVVVGNAAGGDIMSGSANTAIGGSALVENSTGNLNVALGYGAGASITGDNNIAIQNAGTSADEGVIRIGTSGTQTSFFAAGISGVTTGLNDAVPVVVDSNGQLGTVSSSRRFKEDIQDMDGASRGLMQLRPVTFRYQKPFADGSKPVQYGLIAEEVAEVYPDLVARSADGQIETVKYQVLDSMLLNEIQRQQNEAQSQRKVVESQQTEIRGLQERLAKIEALLAAIAGAK